jgi:hypothetical protein
MGLELGLAGADHRDDILGHQTRSNTMATLPCWA